MEQRVSLVTLGVADLPRAVAFYEALGWTTAKYDFRWRVPPGLTGLAQVIGPPAPRASLFLDRTYVGRQNLWLDVRLIALSFAVNALGKQRVRELLIRRRDSRLPRTRALKPVRPAM